VTISLLVLVAIMAIVVGWLWRQTLGVRPWIEQRPIENVQGEAALSLPPVKVGLGVFLAVATSLFALLISAYFMRMMGTDWTTLAVPRVLWLNTGVLILSSVAMQWTRAAARRGQIDRVRIGLVAGGVFSFSFLVGQLWAWQQLNASGYSVAGNPASAFFYLLTALHGLHLLGGLWVWGKTIAKVRRGVEVGEVRLSVELCAVYWHYLLLVWLVLFAVLLSSGLSSRSTDITGADFGKDFQLTDYNGQPRRLSDFRGKVVAVFFGYTHCPEVCPTTLAELAGAVKKLGPDGGKVQVLFVTADPERDTPEVLKQYVSAFDPTFVGLRGTLEQTAQVAKDFQLIIRKNPGVDANNYSVDHSAGTYLYDASGKLRLYVRYGQGADAFADEIGQLLKAS
jgi:cytochrome c oxidase subunit III